MMSTFLLPKSFCESINAGLRKFWWGFPQDKRHSLSLLAWDNICQPKAFGGLGIRSMLSLNNSLLAKLGWKLISNQPLLWVDVLWAKYLRNGVSFLKAPNSPLSSWIWKGLLKNRKVVEKGACISISNGLNVEIWNSPWIPQCLLLSLFLTQICSLFQIFFCFGPHHSRSRVWNTLLLHDLFDLATVHCIESIHLAQTVSFDKWQWVLSPSGIFSVKSAMKLRSLPLEDLPFFLQNLGINYGD
ncbi:hypothetical protein SLA2020_420550 [Shorea laevis]